MNPILQNILFYTQIVVCVLIVVSVLLQNRAEGLGKMFGGGGEVFRTKRGFEKFLYYFTIFLTLVLVAISLVLVKYS
ncbi:MAG: preprotein translocase subunit SecG [Candidatus Dojkabacteria bacterium]|jgi:protein translocase SecG subunit